MTTTTRYRGAFWIGLLLVSGLACSGRPADPAEDHSEEVAKICADFCGQALACLPPDDGFESYEDCEGSCLTLGYIYNDSACGDALRDAYACIGSTPTCEAFLDTNNVDAEDYTCKAEKEHYTSLTCEEDPMEGAP